MNARPLLEFVSAQRAPFHLAVNDVVIGRSHTCTLQVDAAGVADRHARITVDAMGNAWIENYEADAFTMYNGLRLTGKQRLGDGDRIEIGLCALTFRSSGATASATALPPVSSKAHTADKTMLGSQMPAELKKVIEERRAAAAAATSGPKPAAVAPLPKPTEDEWESAPATVMDSHAAEKARALQAEQNKRGSSAQRTMQLEAADIHDVTPAAGGVVVGTPEPEPTANRTLQMEPADVAKLGFDFQSPTSPSVPSMQAPKPAAAPPPAEKPAVPFRAKATMMGVGVMAPPKGMPPAKPAAPPAPAAPSPPAKAAPQQATAFMDAPKLPAPASLTPAKAAPQQATAFMDAPKLPAAPAPTPAKAAPQQATAFMDAPKLPPSPGFPKHATAPQIPVPQPSSGFAAQPEPAMPSPPAQAYTPPAPAYTPAPAPPAPAYTPPPAQTPPAQAYGKPAFNSPSSYGMPLPQSQGGNYVPASLGGALGPFSRAFEFVKQMFSLASQERVLLKPLVFNLFLTTPVMALFTVIEFFVNSPGGFYALMGIECFLLYFIDYTCNALTASLVFDAASTGHASMDGAVPRVKKALPGILTFAAVSALLDVASTYARERNDVLGKILLRVLRAIWTTATYVIMPALVIEGVPFGEAFGRSKKLMDQDPTGVGAGVVALSLTSYIVAAICFPLSYFLFRVLAHVHPAIGALAAMLVVNLYWSVSGWLKISYATCFYMWARSCEESQSQDPALAPAPLAAALRAA